MNPGLRARLARAVAGLAVAALLLAGAGAALRKADDHARRDLDEQLLYLPNEKLLTHFTGGMSSIIANMLWLHCIQYTAKELHGARAFEWLRHMVYTVVRLDPNFVGAYRYGAVFLAMLKADDDAGIELLRQGIRENPWAWELPYELGMIWLLNRHTHPASEEIASHYFAMSVATGRAPDFVKELTLSLQEKHDLRDIERDMWLSLAHSEDGIMRDLAERRLIELTLRETAEALSEAVRIYRTHTGRAPESLQALVEQGLISHIPEDPLGGRFLMDDSGEVLNTTLLDARADRMRNQIRNALGVYQRRHGNWPESLEALAEAGFLFEAPEHPNPEREWRYDPASGELQD